MSFFNYGLDEGLAYKHDFNHADDLAYRSYVTQRNNRIDAENKAKLLGEDFKFGKVSGSYNRKLLDDFNNQTLKEVADFVIKNPNFQVNPVQMAQYNQIKSKLLDNPILTEDMRTTTHYNNFVDFLSKNPDLSGNSDVQRMLKEYDNYNKYGTTTPGSGKSEFAFINPISKVDTSAVLKNYFSALKNKTLVEIPGDKKGGYRKIVDPQDMQTMADQILSNTLYNKKLNQEFDSIDPQVKKDIYHDDIREWIMKAGEPYVPAPDYLPPTDGTGTGSGSSSGHASTGPATNLLRTGVEQAKASRTGFAMDARGISRMFGLNDKLDRFNLADSDLMSSAGVRQPTWDEKARAYLRNVKATPTGVVHYNDKTKTGEAEFEVQMPVSQFAQMYGDKPVDYGGLLGGVTDSPRSVNDNSNWSIHNGDGWDKDYTDVFTQTPADPETGAKYVRFVVRKPFAYDSPSAAAAYQTTLASGTDQKLTSGIASKYEYGAIYNNVEGMPNGAVYRGTDNEGNLLFDPL